MKLLLIITACLLSSSVMAQTGSLKIDSSGVASFGNAWRSTNQPLKFLPVSKPVISISPPDEKGNYKVWFDRKRIKRLVWTSDSTFTLKSK